MKDRPILVVGLNPVIQKTLLFDRLTEGEVNRTSRHRLDASGKGMNVARVLAQLGVSTLHVTHAGGLFRDIFLRMARQEGIGPLCADSGSEIRQCVSLVNEEQHVVTEIVEESEPVGPTTDAHVRSLFSDALGQVATVTISGTKAAGYRQDIIPWMVRESVSEGKIVILDVRGKDLLDSLPHRPAIIKTNMKEFIETFFPASGITEHGNGWTNEEAVEEKMIRLWKQFGITTILTRGPRPVLACIGGKVVEFPVERIVPVNPIGSGDAFTAALALGMQRRFPMDRNIALAIACGKANALHVRPGTIAEHPEGSGTILRLLEP